MKPFDEQRSDELNAALREIMPAPPLDAVNWSALQGRIAAQAELLLRGRRELRGNMWQTLSGWSRRGIPLTMAAAAAVLLALGLGVQRVDTASGFRTVEEVLAVGDGAETSLLGSSDDELLDALLFNDEGN